MSASLLSLPEAQEIINLAFSNINPQSSSSPAIPTVLSITALPDIHFSSIFILTLSSSDPSNTTKVVLKVSPPPTIRLLYNDLNRTATEASVLELLSNSSSITTTHSSSKNKTNASLSAILNPRTSTTQNIIFPQLIYHGPPNTASLTSPWLLQSFLPSTESAPLPGTKLTNPLDQHLTIVRRLSTITNPAGTFGPITSSSSFPGAAPSSLAGSPGPPALTPSRPMPSTYPSWRPFFTSMLEAVLRDGEAAQVMLDYAMIREQLGRLGGFLDTVREARLVVFGVRVMGEGEVTGLDEAVWGDGEMGVVLALEDEGDAEDVEDEGTKARRGLYRVFRAVTRIVRCYYYEQDAEVEMRERRRLVEVLRGLEGVGGKE